MASFQEFAEICQSLSNTSSRLQIAQIAGEFLARLDPAEAATATRFMVGRALEQGEEKRLQVSSRAIWKIATELTGGEDRGEEIFASATDFGEAIEILLRLRSREPEPTLTIADVARRLTGISQIEGRNSRRRKLEALRELFVKCTSLEGKYLAKILIREMRHGMSEGLMLEAIARMANRPVAEVRRLHMLEGDIGRVAAILRSPAGIPPPTATSSMMSASAPSTDARDDAAARPGSSLAGATPIRPMLAAPAPDIAAAFRILEGSLALEHKLDGARVQIHCGDSEVRIFSRRMNEITPSLPEIVEAMAAIRGRRAIFDGEVIAVNQEGGAMAFQEVMRRFGRVREIDRLREVQPLRLYLFDLMALDGQLLIDTPYEDRYARLQQLANDAELRLADRLVPSSLVDAQRFYAKTIAAGNEGVMAKALRSLYTPGARGRGWLKIKNARTLDLVIVAADWGYGRRHGWLSNYHLAARDELTGAFVEVGKTFKGMTDADFREMTERLLAIKTSEAHGTVFVRPEVVVEVAYSDIQRSSQYDGGMALRFARIAAVRSDKSPDEADTIQAVMAEYDRQAVKPAGAV